MHIIAHIISYITHPLLIPTYCLLFLIWVNPYMFGTIDSPRGAQLVLSGLLNTFLLPVFCIFLMRVLGFIDDFQLKDRRQRVLPYMAVSFFFLWTYFPFKQAFNIEILSDVMLGAGLAVMISLTFNILINKISIHAIGVSGFVALVIYTILLDIPVYNISYFLYLTILIAGLVGTARLLLGAHEMREVMSGYLVGFVCMFFAFII